MIIETQAYARAGLLGNPSDGYFGKTISITVGNFGAHVSLYQTPELHIEPQNQDRVIQVYEGCVFMNFDKEIMDSKGHGHYERIDPKLLPKLYIAYKTDLGKVSGKVLSDIKTRWEKGDEHVVKTLQRIAEIAEEGKDAIRKKDYKRLNQLIDENFDQRSKIMNISDSNKELVQTARNCGASAKFTGSGGSIIGMYTDDDMLTKLVVALKNIKARVIKPYLI